MKQIAVFSPSLIEELIPFCEKRNLTFGFNTSEGCIYLI